MTARMNLRTRLHYLRLALFGYRAGGATTGSDNVVIGLINAAINRDLGAHGLANGCSSFGNGEVRVGVVNPVADDMPHLGDSGDKAQKSNNLGGVLTELPNDVDVEPASFEVLGSAEPVVFDDAPLVEGASEEAVVIDHDALAGPENLVPEIHRDPPADSTPAGMAEGPGAGNGARTGGGL